MALRDADIRKIISTILLSIGSFLLVSDVQQSIKSALGTTGSLVFAIVILLIAGYLFKL